MAGLNGLSEMKFEVKPSPAFIRQTKDILKKYKKMKTDIRKCLARVPDGTKAFSVP